MKKQLQLRKSLGQNFLTSDAHALEILEASGVTSDDVVIEIGPGGGMLTQYLIGEVGELILVEVDKRFADQLKDSFSEYKHVTVLNEDVLKLDLHNLKHKHKHKHKLSPFSYKVIGALPYNISKKIIEKFLESEIAPESMTFVIQKEVAQDYTAQAPKATFLSNYVKVFADCDYIGTIPKDKFRPVPKVDGGIIKIKSQKSKVKNEDKKRFVKFLKRGFMNPRKKLVNNLVGITGKDKEMLRDLFSELRINVHARAAELEFDQWQKLYERLMIK